MIAEPPAVVLIVDHHVDERGRRCPAGGTPLALDRQSVKCCGSPITVNGGQVPFEVAQAALPSDVVSEELVRLYHLLVCPFEPALSVAAVAPTMTGVDLVLTRASKRGPVRQLQLGSTYLEACLTADILTRHMSGEQRNAVTGWLLKQWWKYSFARDG